MASSYKPRDQYRQQNSNQDLQKKSNAFPNGVRIPPQSIEAEMALLGSIMLRPEAIYDVMDIIVPASFYSERHRMIYETMLELMSKRSPIDVLSLSSRLSEKSILEQIGGARYLTELVGTVPSAANVEHYGHIVQKKHMMRSLIEAGEEIEALGYDEEKEIDEILDSAEKKMFELSTSSTQHKFQELKGLLGESFERIDQLHKNKQEIRGVPTGFREMDARLAGLQKSDLIILAARPSMGKTSLALDIARQAAVEHNIPVGIFSLEMGSAQLVERMLASESSVDSWKIHTAQGIQESDFDKMRDALDTLSKAPIFIDDQPGNNIMKMRSVARRLKMEKGLGLIVVDYLQLMVPTQSKNNDNMVMQVTEISRSLKQLARELKVPVLALSQLSRAVEQRGGEPRLSDLRDSGSIEQDADVVMFIHREDKINKDSDRPNIAKIIIAKHRNGPTGEFELYFDEKRTRFLPLEKNNFGDFSKATQSENDPF